MAIDQQLVAACGMNCGLCLAYLREKNRCEGCRSINEQTPRHCKNCSIVNCEFLAKTSSKFCYECEKYPCRRLKLLDKRYRANYHMSMFENLTFVKENGIEAFIQKEEEIWKCTTCGGMKCVHRGYCLKCGQDSTNT